MFSMSVELYFWYTKFKKSLKTVLGSIETLEIIVQFIQISADKAP